MALNEPKREAIIKAAKEEDRLKEIKFSQSLGSVLIDGKKYTDSYYAVKNLKGNK